MDDQNKPTFTPPSRAPAAFTPNVGPSQREPDTMIPMINRDARLYSFAITKPRDADKPAEEQQLRDPQGRPELTPRETEEIKLHPGLNYHPLTKVQAAGVVRDGRPALELFRGRVEIADPCSLAPFDADKVIEMTHSKSALERWLAVERRPEIKAKISERIPLAKAA